MDYEVLRELAAISNEKVSMEAQVEKYKSTFANELLNITGKEIIDSIKNNKPVKFKKPFKMRMMEKLHRIKEKIKIVLDF